MRATKEMNKNKGITLIALVITIIVMLILVAVTISMAVNGGLFGYAGKAVGDTNNAMLAEGQLGSGRIQVGGVWYDSIDAYIAGIESENQSGGTTGGENTEGDGTTGGETGGENTEGDTSGGNENTLPSYNDATKDAQDFLTEKALYTDGNKDTAVIPKGYAVSSVTTERTIDTGLVIKDANGNEFVWIPVKKAIVTESEIETIKNENASAIEEIKEDYSITNDSVAAVQWLVNNGTYPMAVEVNTKDDEGNITETNYKGILYEFSGTTTLTATVYDWTSGSSNREPANLTGSKKWFSATTVNGTTVVANTSYIFDSQEMFTLYGVGTYSDSLYQNSFNSMVDSVAENGGFYVGRYEISSGTYTLADGSTVTYAQSKSNQTALVSTEWYNMYKYERDYAKCNTKLGVASEMIWGSQWDQMMVFVNGKYDGRPAPAPFYVTKHGSRKQGTSSITLTGNNTVDQVANIFDLEASRYEFTQEASSSDYRGHRSGNYYSQHAASYRNRNKPTYVYSDGLASSRASLYIK